MIAPLLGGWLVLALAAPDDLSAQVNQIFQSRCLSCHGPAQKGGLRLDRKAAIFEGGASGPILKAGNARASEIFRRIGSADLKTRMPPKGEPLSAKEIDLITRWIDAGTPWSVIDSTRDPRLDHWAWQPLRNPQPPQTFPRNGTPESHHPIDRCVAIRLTQSGLTRAPQADRRTLIRRLSFDLLGLPPRPEEVAAFERDSDPQAYEKLLDRYLSSPHYGERWARHWLDIAHYADTHGFERDQRRDHAWRYRDWVIQAFNDDMPFPRFLEDQIAGDVLRPTDSKAIIATGFLAAGPWDFVGQAETPSPVLKRQARADDLDDMLTQVIAGTCGITINCARCHDHKIDPVSQREYYSLISVFAGVTRGDREADPAASKKLADEKQELSRQIAELEKDLAKLEQRGLDLADLVGGGDGRGKGTAGLGINLVTGKPQKEKTAMVPSGHTNQFARVENPFIDGVVIVQGGPKTKVPLSSTGLFTDKIPLTSGQAWDAIRHGPVNDQKATTIGATDYASSGHSLLGLHANAAITFPLAPFRKELAAKDAGGSSLRFRAAIGYGGRPAAMNTAADAWVLVDGKIHYFASGVGPRSAPLAVDIELPESAQFLTLMATEGKDGNIGFDQIFFGDANIQQAKLVPLTDEQKLQKERLQKDLIEKRQRQSQASEPAKVYGIVSGTAPEVRIQKRGNPEQTGDLVSPAAFGLIQDLPAALGSGSTPEGERRKALAGWITDERNPLPSRIIVNRLWHHHFGSGIVDTPSDFGLAGGKPTHPELLDWLAGQLRRNQGSLKAIHRLICTSETYKQKSNIANDKARSLDAQNRLLWKQNPRRLDAESLRDAVLFTSGTLNSAMFGPGFRDFNYKEEYAPVYGYITPDQPELWRRSIYRFIVRTTPQPLLTTLDCPNPASLTPARNATTTALQALALLNNDFLLRQSSHFAARLEKEFPGNDEAKIERAFVLALCRPPSSEEKAAALALARKRGLEQFCRMLFNANEFVHLD